MSAFAAAFAVRAIWGYSVESRPGHRAAPARTGTAVAPAVGGSGVSVVVTGAHCQVFVGIPGGDILLNRDMPHGETVHVDEPHLYVVLADAASARVYVNGLPKPLGAAGQRVTFTIPKG